MKPNCHKCCFWPCDRTAICADGVYYTRDRWGNVTKWIEPSELLKPIISEAVIKALEEPV